MNEIRNSTHLRNHIIMRIKEYYLSKMNEYGIINTDDDNIDEQKKLNRSIDSQHSIYCQIILLV